MVSAAVLIVVFLSAVVWCGVVRGGGRPPWDLPVLLLSFGPVLPLDICCSMMPLTSTNLSIQ